MTPIVEVVAVGVQVYIVYRSDINGRQWSTLIALSPNVDAASLVASGVAEVHSVRWRREHEYVPGRAYDTSNVYDSGPEPYDPEPGPAPAPAHALPDLACEPPAPRETQTYRMSPERRRRIMTQYPEV